MDGTDAHGLRDESLADIHFGSPPKFHLDPDFFPPDGQPHDASAYALLLVPSGSAGRRVRSGSLFLTNLIWNDDALSNSPSHTLTSAVIDLLPDSASAHSPLAFLSPSLQPQTQASTMRSRSHTTLGHFFAEPARLSTSPFLQPHQDVLDAALLGEHTRNRSQTYSGIPQLGPNAIPGIMYPGTTLLPVPPAQPRDFAYLLARQPFLEDDFNIFELLIKTSFDNSSLGPTNTLLFDNLPQFFDAAKLHQLLTNTPLQPPGSAHRDIASIRMSQTSNSKMALVVASSVEVAMMLKAAFNHLKIVPGVILYVAFAKVLDKVPSLTPAIRAPARNPAVSVSLEMSRSEPPFLLDTARPNGSAGQVSTSLGSIASPSDTDEALQNTPSGLTLAEIITQLTRLDASAVAHLTHSNINFLATLRALPEPLLSRKFDAPRLRELRKQFEAETETGQDAMLQDEYAALAHEMLDELPELCYDHIGNTLVQKLFSLLELHETKLKLIQRIAPYLAQLGIHKNGTWAVQKVINLSLSSEEKQLISRNLREYAVRLFNDQYGNYVLQCCLRFGSPYNDFLFQAMCENFMEISSGRFGSRCIRTILESANENGSCVTSEQMAVAGSLIVKHVPDLLLNSNGSLLVTWLMDLFRGFEPDSRFALLLQQIRPHLAHLCTHKLGNLGVFKLMTRADAGVRMQLLDAMFGPFSEHDGDHPRPPTKLLELILAEGTEANAGPLFVYKVITRPLLVEPNTSYQYHVYGLVRRVLLELNIGGNQAYKKLMDEVGLAARVKNGARRKRLVRRSDQPNGPDDDYRLQPNGQYSEYDAAMQQFQPDATIMKQLERLSLSSVAMGYASNPGTPVAGPQTQYF